MWRLNEFSLQRLSVILLVPALLAAVSAGWHPATLHSSEWDVTVSQIAEEKQVLWLDVRSEADYVAGHVEDAFWFNPEEWDVQLPMLLQLWQPDNLVVVYCSSNKCQTSLEVARRLRMEVGLERVFYLKGGWEELVHSNERYGIEIHAEVKR
ncbi:MAG: rhodanese-like domain-containing protein [Verrucomicrobiota bacterium]